MFIFKITPIEWIRNLHKGIFIKLQKSMGDIYKFDTLYFICGIRPYNILPIWMCQIMVFYSLIKQLFIGSVVQPMHRLSFFLFFLWEFIKEKKKESKSFITHRPSERMRASLKLLEEEKEYSSRNQNNNNHCHKNSNLQGFSYKKFAKTKCPIPCEAKKSATDFTGVLN